MARRRGRIGQVWGPSSTTGLLLTILAVLLAGCGGRAATVVTPPPTRPELLLPSVPTSYHHFVTDLLAGDVATTSIQSGDGKPPLPNARLTVEPSVVVIGQQATFSMAFSTESGGSATSAGSIISRYTWDFGDGSPVAGTGEPTVDHTYTRAGTFIVLVTLQDQQDDTGDATLTVVVTKPDQSGDLRQVLIDGGIVLMLVAALGYVAFLAFQTQLSHPGRKNAGRKHGRRRRGRARSR